MAMLSQRVGQQRQSSTEPPRKSTETTGPPPDRRARRRPRDSNFAVRVIFVVTFLVFFGCFSFIPESSPPILFPSISGGTNGNVRQANVESVWERVTNLSYQSRSGNVTIYNLGVDNIFRRNAIVILAQKKHATYKRNSYGLLLKSLDLLVQNYLQIGNHHENTDVFIFHTGDFDTQDLIFLESSIFSSTRRGIVKLIDLNGTAFWTLPPWHANDNQADWVGSDIFPIGYRHMCRWFGVKIWQFFEELNAYLGCSYRHLLRIDEDSLILSPIRYDIFEYMLKNEFVYGFRLCAYELEYNRLIAPWLGRWKLKHPMKREMHRNLCGFYNNFFVADLKFFNSPPVQKYLRTLDRQGFIYRKRYGDLMIHSTAVYAYAEPSEIHRFLDFTYSHVTRDYVLHPEQGCVVWGGIQAGYTDPNAENVLGEYYQKSVLDRGCTANVSVIAEQDLSPTYQHIPPEWKGEVALKTIVAGKVEMNNRGEHSG